MYCLSTNEELSHSFLQQTQREGTFIPISHMMKRSQTYQPAVGHLVSNQSELQTQGICSDSES